MKINTIICNYNYGRFIKDAIESCLNQTVKNKIVIVDDNSTDDSIEIAAKLLNAKKRSFGFVNEKEIFIYEGENGVVISLPDNFGPSVARNVGVQYDQNADYYQILDADDYMYPSKIETLLTEMSDGVGVVYADYDILNLNNNITLREFKKSFSLEKIFQECIVHSGSLIKKEALFSIAGAGYIWHEGMRTCEDYHVWIRIIQQGWKIRHIPQSLTLVRNHINNSTNSRSKTEWNQNWSIVNNEITKTQKQMGLI